MRRQGDVEFVGSQLKHVSKHPDDEHPHPRTPCSCSVIGTRSWRTGAESSGCVSYVSMGMPAASHFISDTPQKNNHTGLRVAKQARVVFGLLLTSLAWKQRVNLMSG